MHANGIGRNRTSRMSRNAAGGSIGRIAVAGFAAALIAGCAGQAATPAPTIYVSRATTAPAAAAQTPTPPATDTAVPSAPLLYETPAPGQSVYDHGKFLSVNNARAVNLAGAAFATKYGCSAWFITETMHSADQVTHGNALKEAHEIQNEWAVKCDFIFVFMSDNRDTWFAWGYVTDGMPDASGSVFEDAVDKATTPLMKQGNRAGAFLNAIKEFGKVLTPAA
jgi:hypothetical protein